MGEEGTGLRSRGYEVRILAAAPKDRRRKRRELIPNVLKPGTLLVPLTQGRFAIIDEADAAAVSRHTWSAAKATESDSLYYAVTKIDGRVTKLHRFLWALSSRPAAPRLDHENGDGLDNRQANLRPATPAQNVANSRLQKRNTSGYKGVTWLAGKWVAQLGSKYIGRFTDPAEAHRAYLNAARERYGEFARAS